jgi:hypothetical protein
LWWQPPVRLLCGEARPDPLCCVGSHVKPLSSDVGNCLCFGRATKNVRWSSKKLQVGRAKRCKMAEQKLNKKCKMVEQKMQDARAKVFKNKCAVVEQKKGSWSSKSRTKNARWSSKKM